MSKSIFSFGRDNANYLIVYLHIYILKSPNKIGDNHSRIPSEKCENGEVESKRGKIK